MTSSSDGLTWQIKLRDGLKFHDNPPVLARDCVASLMRWSKRDSFGQTLATQVDAWEAPDDKTIRIRLKRPFAPLPDALAKCASVVPFIMPERLAKTDPNTQVTEMVGSGPFRFVKDEFVSGSRVVYSRFDGYVPRPEPASFMAGGKHVFFDRVEWQVIPDASTAAGALRNGEVDWWEFALPDLIPLFAQDKAVKVTQIDDLGFIGILRFKRHDPAIQQPEVARRGAGRGGPGGLHARAERRQRPLAALCRHVPLRRSLCEGNRRQHHERAARSGPRARGDQGGGL